MYFLRVLAYAVGHAYHSPLTRVVQGAPAFKFILVSHVRAVTSFSLFLMCIKRCHNIGNTFKH
jgi:hypothetical protein